MKAVLIIISALALLAVIVVAGFYAFFTYSVKNMHRKQPIAENIEVTSDWFELKPEQPLEPTRQVQKVMLLIEGYEHNVGDNDFGNIKLADGTKISPEVQIVDDNNKIYHLRDSSRLGNAVGFTPNEKVNGTHSFAKDVKYKLVRIRSDKPFRLGKIYWDDHDLK